MCDKKKENEISTMHYNIIGDKGGKGVWKLAEVSQIQWIKRRNNLPSIIFYPPSFP